MIAPGRPAALLIPVSRCSLFIQIWADSNALVQGKTTGVYVVDNNVSRGSKGEGTPSLLSTVSTGTCVCWQLLSIAPDSPYSWTLQDIGNALVWGASGQPQPIDATTWTGQVQVVGTSLYQVQFTAADGMGVQIFLELGMEGH